MRKCIRDGFEITSNEWYCATCVLDHSILRLQTLQTGGWVQMCKSCRWRACSGPVC